MKKCGLEEQHGQIKVALEPNHEELHSLYCEALNQDLTQLFNKANKNAPIDPKNLKLEPLGNSIID